MSPGLFRAFSGPKTRPAAVAEQTGRLTWFFFIMFDERGCLLLFCSSRVETVENVICQGQVETNQALTHLIRRTGA